MGHKSYLFGVYLKIFSLFHYAIKAYQNYQNQGGKQKISVYTRSILNTTDLSLNDAYNLNYLIDL